MIRWWIVIAAQTPEELDTGIGRRDAVLANWETSVGGNGWVQRLVDEGKAVQLLSGGYPSRYQEAGITYTYKVNNLADWAKKPEVQAAFPVVKGILDGVGNKESKHAVKLTSQGWEAKGLD